MKISIVTTIYNVESFIKDCVDSLINQSYKDLEIILVNDCSTDKTMEIVNEYEDDRIVIINNSENLGAGYSRKVGIEYATGEYVITVDGDDWLSEDFIEKLVENAKETKADIVSGGITYVFSDEYEEIHKFKPTISTGFKKFLDYGNKKIVFLNNKLVKRSMYDTVPYNTRRYCEDTPVILPLLYYANAVSYVDT
jgi:glycosyltransferase involved in cell wall biosynthesis